MKLGACSPNIQAASNDFTIAVPKFIPWRVYDLLWQTNDNGPLGAGFKCDVVLAIVSWYRLSLQFLVNRTIGKVRAKELLLGEPVCLQSDRSCNSSDTVLGC
jgi:hypothetical protein